MGRIKMKLKKMDSLTKLNKTMRTLRKIMEYGYNLGKDSRGDQIYSALQVYETYNSELDILSEEDTLERSNKLLGKLLDLKEKFSDASKNYVSANIDYLKILFDEIAGNKSEFDRIERRDIKQKSEEAFLDICDLVRETLEKTNFIDLLVMRENRALKELGLDNFISDVEKEEYKKNLLSSSKIKNMISRSDEIKNHTMCLFWVNKISKVIDDYMVGYCMEKTQHLFNSTAIEGNSLDFSKMNDRDKMIVLLRVDLMKDMFRYANNRFSKENYFSSDLDFENYLDNAGVYFNFSDLLRYMIYYKSDENSFPEIRKYFEENKHIKRFYENLPQDFMDKMDEVESLYNQLFAPENEANSGLTFVHDAFILAQMDELQKIIYNIKTELTSVLSFILLLEKGFNPAPYCKVWGTAPDKNSHDDSNVSNIFFVELPGCIQPLMVHMEDMVLDGLLIAERIKVPEYQGAFLRASERNHEAFLSTHILFNLNERQKKSLKEAKKYWKTESNKTKKRAEKMPEGFDKFAMQKVWQRECRYYRTLDYMESMVKDKPRDIEVEK